jgi:hypothetical protein
LVSLPHNAGLSAIMLASMEKLAIFKSGFQMQDIEVNVGLKGCGQPGAGLALFAGAAQRT